MSNQINNEEGNTGRNAVDRLSFRDELRAIEKGRATALWLYPGNKSERAENGELVKPNTVYLGEVNQVRPTWEEPVMDMAKYIANMKMLKQGRTSDVYKVLEDPFIGEWKEISKEYADAIDTNRKVKSASVATDANFAAIDVINVMAELQATELRTFTLEQALTTIGTPQLDLKVDTWTRFIAEQGVPEGVAPIPKRGAVSRASYDLMKDVALIGMTDEAQLRTLHDLYRVHVDNAVSDFKRIKSNKIATKLNTATPTAGADWNAYTTDHSTTDPKSDIGARADAIFANNGAPNILASNDRVFRTFVSSTYTKGVLQAVPLPDMSMAKVINQVPSLPGFTWYIDNEMTANTIAVFDRSAVAMLQGPVRTAQYRLEIEGIDGYIHRDWNLPIFIVPNRVSLITGVTV